MENRITESLKQSTESMPGQQQVGQKHHHILIYTYISDIEKAV